MSDLEEITKAAIIPLISWTNRTIVSYEYQSHISHNAPLEESKVGPLKAIRISDTGFTISAKTNHIEIDLTDRSYHTLLWEDPQLIEKIEQIIYVNNYTELIKCR